jgi:hypothetical protein
MKKLFLLVAVAAGLSGLAQKNGSKLSFPKGQKLEMTAQTKAVITQEVMGQAMDMNVNSTIVRSFDIEEVNNGTARIEHKIKKLQFAFDAMGQTQSFDSEKPEDMKSELGKNLEKSIKNKYSMSVDETGTILNVKSDDENPNAADSEKAEGDIMSNMMGQFAEGLQVPKKGEIISLKVTNNGQFNKGQSWTDSLSGEENGTVKYTVTSLTDKEVLIDYVSEGITKKKQEVGGGMEMDVNLKNKTSGTITLDKKTGLLKQRTVDSEGSGTMEVMGQSIPMKSKITGTITVNGF